MYGAILGDMIGSPYEFDRGKKTKEFPLFTRESKFTDDTVMTIAVGEALLNTIGGTDEEIRDAVTAGMRIWGKKYPWAGYGQRFFRWLGSRDPKPYGSYGNGSAMRVSAAGWLFDTLEETRHAAKLTSEVTHNHPEGTKGAEATACAIFLARTGSSKEDIRQYIVKEFDYDLSRSCDEIRPGYYHVESCQQTVPEAITAFLEGESFEDVIRTAVSLGGDCDTLTCIAGSIAEAFYGVPDELIRECRKRLPKDMLYVLDRFKQKVDPFHDPFLDGNESIEEAIHAYRENSTKETLSGVLNAIMKRASKDGHFMIPVEVSEGEAEYILRTVETNDGKAWHAVFTTRPEYEKGPESAILSNFIYQTMEAFLDSGSPGCIINPWGESFILTRDLMQDMFIVEHGETASE